MLAHTVVLFALAVAACGGYRPGSFADPRGGFAGQRRTVGCLDVAVAPGRAPAARGAAVEVTFANRCDAPVRVDLAAIAATGLTSDGRPARLALHDPRGAVRDAWLEARVVARETLEYAPPDGSPAALARLCLDLGPIDAGAPAAAPAEVCVTP